MKQDILFSQAIRDALSEEMRLDPNVILLGEDIAQFGGAFKVTNGLVDEFGPERVVDTPISENSLVGLAVGAAILGMRPIVEIMFMDFITLAMDQIVNHAAKFHYMYGEQVQVPLVIRTPSGGGRGYGPTHSQSLEAWFMHVPGLKVVVPSTPADAKGLLKSAIRDPNPVLFIEPKTLYSLRGTISEEDETTTPIGKARIAREGSDILIISYGRMVSVAISAAEHLAQQNGIHCKVLDLRTLAPLDRDAIISSVEEIGRVIILEEDTKIAGVGAEISAMIAEDAFYSLQAPPVRVAAKDVPIPCARSLESNIFPKVGDVVASAKRLMEE